MAKLKNPYIISALIKGRQRFWLGENSNSFHPDRFSAEQYSQKAAEKLLSESPALVQMHRSGAIKKLCVVPFEVPAHALG